MKQDLLSAIEGLILHGKSRTVDHHLDKVRENLQYQPAFSLVTLAYHPFLYLIESEEVQFDIEWLLETKGRIEGLQHYSVNFVFRYNFASLLNQVWCDILFDSITLYEYIVENDDQDLREDDVYLALSKRLKASSSKMMVVHTLPELIVTQIANQLKALPFNGLNANKLTNTSYSSFAPSWDVSIMTMERMTQVHKLFAQLHGEIPIYVDVQSTETGYATSIS